MKTTEIDYSENIIDSRDLYNRLEELQAIRDSVDTLQEELDELTQEIEELEDKQEKLERQSEIDDKNKELESAIAEHEEIKEELDELEDAENEITDFIYGNTLVSEDYWDKYARELVEDIGDIPKNLPDYISNNIDWSGVADDLKADYSEITLQGNTFYYRS